MLQPRLSYTTKTTCWVHAREHATRCRPFMTNLDAAQLDRARKIQVDGTEASGDATFVDASVKLIKEKSM